MPLQENALYYICTIINGSFRIDVLEVLMDWLAIMRGSIKAHHLIRSFKTLQTALLKKYTLTDF